MAAGLDRGGSTLDDSRPTVRSRRNRYGRHRSRTQGSRSHSNDQRHSAHTSPLQQTYNAQSPLQHIDLPRQSYSPPSKPTIRPSTARLVMSRAITMERTPSGNSILSGIPHSRATLSSSQVKDRAAAERVANTSRRLLGTDSKHVRILRKIIYHAPDDSLDDKALDGMLTAADTVFFNGDLKGRVKWEWSSHDRYHTELIGTTALRLRADGNGFETLIVLSEPILRNRSYDRRLLLSVFLHELIHCYLFINCGYEARMQGGHTVGFHSIADFIDGWVGRGYLSLCKLKEDPMRWHRGRRISEDWDAAPDPRLQHVILQPIYVPGQIHGHEGCNQSPLHRFTISGHGMGLADYY